MFTLADSLLPPWLVLPLGGLVLVFIAAHVLGLHSADMPPRRRRIRTATSLLMMLITTLIAWALAIEPMPESRAGRGTHAFVILWLTIIALVGFVVMLALADAMHTLRLASIERRDLRRELREGVHASAHTARAPSGDQPRA